VSGADASQPFFFPAGETGCLLIHGFTATPQEMRFLGERLHGHGFTVSGVQLAGHGTSIDELERCGWRDWYASAHDGLAALQQHTSRVIVVGLSMGALLALQLAVDCPAVVPRIVLLSPALVLANRWLYWAAPTLPLLLPLLARRWRSVARGERDIADARARVETPSYERIPLRAVHQLLQLQAHVRPLLPRVQQPALIVHSRHDHTCLLANVTILERRLGGPVHRVLLDNSYHVITVDADKEQVARAVAAFAGAPSGKPDS
jgi:carboxylesterase